MEETEVKNTPSCPKCQSVVQLEDAFCGACGYDLQAGDIEEGKYREDVFTTLSPTLLYYFITLVFLIIYKATDLFPGLSGNIAVTVIDCLIVIAFWAAAAKDIRPLFSVSKLSAKIIVLTILGAALGSVVVSALAYMINVSLQDDTFYSTDLFQNTSYPLLYATLLIAVQPAIFEEVAFRGFLFNNLRKVTNGTSAIYITGFLFGIMHIQIIGLLWLIPIGLVFAYMRNRYNTLWYGIIGHFTYNFCITLLEFNAIF